MTATLQATTREARGKQLAALRKEGKLPAVVYGPKEETIALTLDARAFEKVLKEAGESTIVTLEGVGEAKDVLIHEVATDPVLGTPLHVDLYAVEKGKKVTVNVPLEFIGEAPVEKKGGVVTKVLHELEIEAMPKDLPHEITIDVSGLEDFDSSILVSDVKAPAGVAILNDPEETIVVASEVEEEPEEPVEQVDMDAIEVEKKGKEEAEGGGEKSE